MSNYYLQPIGGSNNGIPFSEFKGYTCGRQRSNDIMLDGVNISREHCTFTVSQTQFQVYDLQSSNGTYIDGQRITPKMFHTVPVGSILGISCDKTCESDFVPNEKQFVFRLVNRPLNCSKKKSNDNDEKFTKEVAEKRKLTDESPVPCKIARVENPQNGYESDDCILIEDDPVPNIQPELRLPIDQPSTSTVQASHDNNLIKYELDIPEEVSAIEENVIKTEEAPKDSRAEELSLVPKPPPLLNDESNSNDMFSDSPVSSPKNGPKSTIESIKQEPRVTETTNVTTDVIQIDDDDVLVFPSSQLFDDEDVNEPVNDDNGAGAEHPLVSSIIKEECDLGTDNIACYDDRDIEEVEEFQYPVIVLSDDDEEYDCTNNPWYLKLSESQLENRSSCELEALKIEPKDEKEVADEIDEKTDAILDGLLDELDQSEFLMDTREAQIFDEVTAPEAIVTDEAAVVEEPVKPTENVADAAVADPVTKEDVKKVKKDKKHKTPENRRKERQNKPKEKSKARKSEKGSSSKESSSSKQSIDAYEFRNSFEEPAIESYQSTKKDEPIKKKKKKKEIVIKSNITLKSPLIKSIVTDTPVPGSSREFKICVNEDKVKKDGKDEKDSKDEGKDKGAVKKQKSIQEEPKDRDRVEEKSKRVEKEKVQDKKKNKKKRKEEDRIPFEEALMTSDKITDDKKKSKKRKISQDGEERRGSEPVPSTSSASSETPAKESPKVDAETTTLVIDGRKISISNKAEKRIKTIEPPIFTRGGRHGVSATLSAAAVIALNQTLKASEEDGSNNFSDNQEEDYNSALFSNPTKLASSSKPNTPIEEQKIRIRRTLREQEIRQGAKGIHQARSKREKKELTKDRRERLKQIAAEERKEANNNNATTKRINKPRAKISKNRGMFLIPDGVDLDSSKDEDTAKSESVKLSNGPTFDLHAEVIKTNHMNTNPTAVDDLFDVISTKSCPGYPEPPPQEDKDTDSDTSFDMDAIAEPTSVGASNIEDTLMDYTDTETICNEPSTSSSSNNFSAPKIRYSRPVREATSESCTPKPAFSKPSAVVRPWNSSSRQPNRPLRGILKRKPERGHANSVSNGITCNNLPQIGRLRKTVRFSVKPPQVWFINILPGNRIIRKCTQKDAAMPKRANVENTLPSDPSNYLPDLSNFAASKTPPAPSSAPAPNHQNVLTPRHNNIVAKAYTEPRRISAPQLDEFLLKIFEWNPQWLDPKAYDQKAQNNLAIVDSNRLIPHLSSYANYNDYYSIMSNLILLEMWASIVREAHDKGFMKKRRNMHAVIGQNSITQTPIRSTNHTLTVFTADILCDKTQVDTKQHAIPGDLVMLELPVVVEKEIHFRPIFAYVRDYQKTVITPSSAPYNRYLQNTVRNPYAVVTLTMATKSLPLDINFNRVMRMKTRFYMRSNLRMVQAIQHLPSNRLLQEIIHPDVKKEVYALLKPLNCDKYKFATGDKLNDKQAEAVVSITNAVVGLTPKICLVEGPPGTGKSQVIVNIITEILYRQNRIPSKDRRKILVCAPSNAAIDEITMRLMDIRAKLKKEHLREPFRLVRVGNSKIMHHRVRDVSLPELVNRAWDSKGPGDQSADNEITRLNQQISELRLSMRNCEKPIPEGEQIKLKRKLDDWINQLALLQNSKQTRYQNGEKRAYLENKLLANADIITCTLSSCYIQPMEQAFGARSSSKISVCIVDEATQCTEPEALIPLMLGVLKLVLVGDPQQLPATVLSSRAKELKYDKSLFSRIYDTFSSELENPVVSLNTQYRMAHAILYWPNGFFYNNQLQSSVKPLVWPYLPYKVFNLRSVQDNNPYSNSDEATFVVNLIYAIAMGANLDKVEGTIRIGVITPYQDQRKLIDIKLRDKFATVPDNIKNRFIREVSTVDGFQGQEREIIIMSCVRSNGIGFLSDRQRLCVALTRAKHSLFLCGNFKTFERDEAWGALIRDARGRNFYINTDHRADQEKIKQNIIKQAYMK